MGPAFPLFTVAGIVVRVHWTFLLLLAWIFAMGAFAEGSEGFLSGVRTVLFVLAIFACVVLHEFGHAFAARVFGVRTKDVTLLPIGGVARLERMPERPGQELVVAIAGPLVNVAILLVLIPLTLALRGPAAFIPDEPGLHRIDFLGGLVFVNGMLILFNMLPAFPMDGGRVLRALLAMTMDRVRATEIAAVTGQVVAVGFALVGLLIGNIMLMLIAVFVFLGAGAEAKSTAATAALRGLLVRDAMIRRFRVLHASDTLADAADELLAGDQQDFPVLRDGAAPDDGTALVGLLTRSGLISALAASGLAARVGDVMIPPCPSVSSRASIEEAMAIAGDRDRSDEEGRTGVDDHAVPDRGPATSRRRRSAGPCPLVPVIDHDASGAARLVGMVTPENITELIAIRSAVSRR